MSWVLLLPPLLPHPDVLRAPFCLDPATGSAVCLSFHLGKVSPGVWGWDRITRDKTVRVSGSPGLQGSKSEQQLDSGCQLEQWASLVNEMGKPAAFIDNSG